MGSKPVHESGTVCDVNLTVSSKFDCWILYGARIMVASITINDKCEQWPERRYE